MVIYIEGSDDNLNRLLEQFLIQEVPIATLEELQAKLDAFNDDDVWSIIQSSANDIVVVYVYHLIAR